MNSPYFIHPSSVAPWREHVPWVHPRHKSAYEAKLNFDEQMKRVEFFFFFCWPGENHSCVHLLAVDLMQLSLSLSLLSIPSFKITSNTRSTLQRRVGTWKQKTNVFCTCIIYHLCVNSVSADIMKAREEFLTHPVISWIAPLPSPPFSPLCLFPSCPEFQVCHHHSLSLSRAWGVIKSAGWNVQVLQPIHIFPKLTAPQSDRQCLLINFV